MHTACLLVTAVALALPTPKKVVILAGDLDAIHPAGTHEYEKTARLSKHCLGTATNRNDLVIEMHFHGWFDAPGIGSVIAGHLLAVAGAWAGGLNSPAACSGVGRATSFGSASFALGDHGAGAAPPR